ncbi:hypothetical protein F5I97DRAFT_1927485 [Phlebopus sp. FC_14]|nr:hypothetical protein F5I97DRAFT_1927485 [Phlebopus sp. FC_14]
MCKKSLLSVPQQDGWWRDPTARGILDRTALNGTIGYHFPASGQPHTWSCTTRPFDMSTPSPRELSLAIVGEGATGKSMLAAHLHEMIYFSRPHRSKFRFSVVGEERQSAEMWIVVFDSTVWNGCPHDLVQEVKSQETPCCIVGTKLDVLGATRVDADLRSHDYASQFRYFHGVEYIPVSNVTGEGLESLMQHIVDVAYPLPPPRRSLTEILQSAASALLCQFLDVVASCCRLPQPRPRKDMPVPPYIKDDDELRNLSCTRPDWSQILLDRLGARPEDQISVSFIPPCFVAKPATTSERASMEFVRRNTNIAIPRTYCDHLSKLVADHVEGRMLYECWNDLGFFMQFRVACTLRLYVKQLRSLTSDRVGGLVNGELGGPVFNFKEEYGPFRSGEHFRHFCERLAFLDWQRLNRHKLETNQAVPPMPSSAGGEWNLVFTHGDLNATNIMLDDDGALWLIDWGAAGFYPPFVGAL